MTEVRTRSIRHELEHFFTKAQPFRGTLAHTPIVVLRDTGTGVEAICTRHPEDLLAMQDDTVCIQSWPGQSRSDLFTYTVAEARPWIAQQLHTP
jgi:hypothetical protein